VATALVPFLAGFMPSLLLSRVLVSNFFQSPNAYFLSFADLRATYTHDSSGLAKCYYFDVFIFPWDFLSSAVSMPILGFFFVYLLLFNLYTG